MTRDELIECAKRGESDNNRHLENVEPNLRHLEKAELLAELFKRDTGLFAPGKDIPAACGGSAADDGETRRVAYREWYAKKALDSVLGYALGLASKMRHAARALDDVAEKLEER